MSPLLSVRRSHTPSMLSAVTTTGVYSPTSVLSSLSFAKSESCLPDPTLPSSSHANVPESKDKSNCDQLSKAIPIVTVHEAGSEITAVEKEAAVSLVQKPHISEPPNLSERGGGGCNSIASTVCDSLENSPHSGLNFQKNEHEIYLDNLRVLQFGNMGSTAIGDDFLSEGPLSHQNDGDWEEIDVREWQNDPTWPKGMSPRGYQFIA